MIRVLVGNHDSGQIVGLLADVDQALKRLFAAQAGVNENPGTVRSDERAVSGTRTGQNTEFDDGGLPGIFRVG
jgi:hypothetical protein